MSPRKLLHRSFMFQVYVAAIAPARDEKASYVAWGHSAAASPWGTVLVEAEEKETVVYADIGLRIFRCVMFPSTQKTLDLIIIIFVHTFRFEILARSSGANSPHSPTPV